MRSRTQGSRFVLVFLRLIARRPAQRLHLGGGIRTSLFLEESVIAFMASTPDARWESREAFFYDQWHNRSFLRDGAGMMVNCWTSALFDVPPGFQGRGGWHAVRAKMQSVGIYNTKTRTLLAVGKIPPQKR